MAESMDRNEQVEPYRGYTIVEIPNPHNNQARIYFVPILGEPFTTKVQASRAIDEQIRDIINKRVRT